MKIKNLFIFICLAFLSLFMLASCGGKDDDGDDNGNNGNQSSYLTKDELMQILYDPGMNYTMTAVDNEGNTTIVKYNGTVKDTHITSLQVEVSVSTSNTKSYMEYKNNHAYIISFKNGKYVGEEVPSDHLFEYFDLVGAITEDLIVDFGYDTDLGAYRLVYKEQDGSRPSVLCYIENNRLVKVVLKDGDWETVISYSKYGTTVVDLPQYELKEENEDLISLINKYEENYTCTITSVENGETTKLKMMVNVEYSDDGYSWFNIFFSVNGTEAHYQYLNDRLVLITSVEGKYIGVVQDIKDFEIPSLLQEVLPYVDLFEYDSENEKYIYSDDETTITITTSDGHISEIIIVDGDLTNTCQYSNYGTTIVRIPDFKILGEEEENELSLALAKPVENAKISINVSLQGHSMNEVAFVDASYDENDNPISFKVKIIEDDEVTYLYYDTDEEELLYITKEDDYIAKDADEFFDNDLIELFINPKHAFGESADLFEYDFDEKCYKMDADEGTIKIFITDGVITKIVIEEIMDKEDTSIKTVITAQFSEFGQVEVEIPPFRIPFQMDIS